MKKKYFKFLPLLLAFTLGGCTLLNSFLPNGDTTEQEQSSEQSSQKDSSSKSSDDHSSEDHSSSDKDSSSSSQHEHTFSDTWSYDQTYHWHASTCGHDVRSDVAEHTFAVTELDDDGYLVETCSICGYERRTEHTFADTWEYDEFTHWHPATCGHDVKGSEAPHNMVVTNENDDGYLVETCSVCGCERRSAHHFSDEWNYNTTHHWHDCLDAGYEHLKIGYGEHDFSSEIHGDYMVYTCNVCGHTYQELYADSQIANSREMKTYFSVDDYITSTVYFMTGKDDVPYVVFNDFFPTHYVDLEWGSGNRSYFALTQTKEDDYLFKFSGYCGDLYIDTENDLMYLPDGVNDFRMLVALNSTNGVTYIASGFETTYCKIRENLSLKEREGVYYDFDKYNIDLVSYDDIVYIPLATFVDIFLAANNSSYTYNGKDLYKSSGFSSNKWGDLSEADSLENQFYTDSPWYQTNSRSSSLAQFTYNEFCFALDYYYGLKDFRGVNSFDEFFESNGYKNKLTSTNANTYENAMVDFAGRWLCEGHSNYTKVSPFKGGTSYQTVLNTGYANNTKYYGLIQNMSALTDLRNNASKGVGLTFYNNTAILTFDSFKKMSGNTSGINVDDYSYATLHSNCSELLFRKAFKDIASHGGIDNVVIDITLNGGGAVDSLMWLEAYMTDDPFILLNNALTGEISEAHYNVDLNRNGTFGDAGDTYKGQYNFFLMTSNFSFSCGNAFPTMVKMGGMATIIGETSGGGACAVGTMSTASGTILRMSSMHRFGYFDSNDNFILNEDGITPDYSFSRNYFYNDQKINEFVNSLIA